MRQDLLYATRILLRWPGFAIAAILSLALGIGVTTAIFTVANGARAGRSPTPTWKHDRWSSGGPAEEQATACGTGNRSGPVPKTSGF